MSGIRDELDSARAGAIVIATDLASALFVMLLRVHLEEQPPTSGLLTRMLGWLGIAIGVFFVLPIVPLSPVLQILFQGSLALMFFNFWMGEIPPAWTTGPP